ncbi:carbonic anhydrase 3-like [Aphis gossypii]|uniref:carbonic anhydrase 3-like n=1 Tax=Aphis gossypii TaxID=80765 RepID=UPI00101000E9|nr:carbonic anhydrase 3-like [Aphis gossypii]XP_027850348.1 carbonic anhydrase 3-like [Aphis gossypii]XP_050063716.1 carbonic anhydrase 3-like [Aphis gossypii]XP_050063717.1 carbonic anhydrase 3-like [Aphis gossypii]
MYKRDVDDMLMSPLAVNTDDMIVVTMPNLEFRYFDALPKKTMLQNNGLTVTLTGLWAADRQPYIEGANLEGKYNFSHLHFHWTNSDGDDVVNEHIVNGRGHELELHLIFFKGSCQSIVEAGSIKNGIVTLAYLFDVTENQHQGIDHITTYLNNVKTCGQTSIIPVFLLSHLIHSQPVEYFTYTGKIDKRGCECGVTQWIVFTKTSEINREQLDQFRCMLNNRGQAIDRNYRKANPVPAGNNTRPYLVVLNGHHSDSADGDVTAASTIGEEMVSEAEEEVARSRSGGLGETSRRRSLAVVASDRRWPLCVKSTKTQLLRRSFNLNKLLVHNYWPSTTKKIALNNRRLFEPVQRAADVKSENNLRPSLSLINATRPSWK